KLVHVGAAILNTTPLDWRGNSAVICRAIAEAKSRGVSILCLPEMCICGYGCEDAFHSRGMQQMSLSVLDEVATATKGMVVSVGLPVLYRNGLFNTACLICDGRVEGFVAKRFLSGDGIHYEPRWFKPWPAGEVAHVPVGARQVPIGDVFFDCGGVRIGFEICEDAWVGARPAGDLSRKAVDIILNPSASHFAFSKIDVRERLVLEGSRAFGVTYVYANLVGNEAGRAIYDGGAMIATNGKLVASGPRFSFEDCVVTSAVVDVEATRLGQSRLSSFVPDVEEDPRDCVTCALDLPEVGAAPSLAARPAWEDSSARKEEEMARAEALALFDYLRKSKAQGFVVSLSGGADSASVACLVKIMVELGVATLGLDGFVTKLNHPKRAQGATDTNSLVRALLTCVYQATEHSSETTREAAKKVAEGVGADFLVFNVDPFFKQYVAMVSDGIGRSIEWDRDDLALQNIQARVRAPGAWMLANLRGALLLCTSNRSEAAVGYATMDGDTCGGISPLGGIDKAFLRRWLVWLETRGPNGVGPIPSLSYVNAQQPTAELKPAAEKQTDERDLMPYEVLDVIERLAIRDKLGPADILAKVRIEFPDYQAVDIHGWVERFFRLWCRNQWKRERYAPSFHLDDENLDPKTWCRFPILSGGYERELAELRAKVTGGKS
ncbi:MAG: NAD(+) synthase, partial [Deltaproteobacteria bacterium RIFOXYA12_FULL_58_15]